MKKFFSMVCACLLALSAQATDIKKYDALLDILLLVVHLHIHTDGTNHGHDTGNGTIGKGSKE